MRRLRTRILWRVLFESSWMLPDSTGTRSNPIWISGGTSPSAPVASPSSWMLRNSQFGITIELEDFIHVRTVKDIAQRISMIVARQEGAGLQPAAKAADPGPVGDGMPKSAKDEAGLKRLVFNQVR